MVVEPEHEVFSLILQIRYTAFDIRPRPGQVCRVGSTDGKGGNLKAWQNIKLAGGIARLATNCDGE
jgi:hypothetical protein